MTIFLRHCGLEFRPSAKPNLVPLPGVPNVGGNLQPGGECTRLILVKDGFGGDLGALDQRAEEHGKDIRI
jgi:hypothetical protein